MDFEIVFFPYNSGDIHKVLATGILIEYEMKEDGSENVEYELEHIEIERQDGSAADLDEDELESLLSKYDHSKMDSYVIEEVRYFV